MRRWRTIGLALTTTALMGCDDGNAVLPVQPTLEEGHVTTYLVQEPGGTADRVTLTVHVAGKNVPVAAYQGTLKFAADALEILEATTPGDGSRLVNARAGAGLVRFAGFSTDRFTQTPAVQLVVRPLRPLESAQLAVSLQVVGEVTGAAVQASRLVAAPGLYRGTVPAAR
jgi:hypothetical protein